VNKIVAIHQPNYLPWLGFFHKIASADIFVLLDIVQYPRGRSVANRNKIKTAQGAQWITIPISTSKGQPDKGGYLKVVPSDERWKKKHLKALQINYGRAPYFQPHFDQISEILLSNQHFAEMNIILIRYFLNQFDIHTPIYRLSEFTGFIGKKSQMIINICSHFGAAIYLSGRGAIVYNDEGAFAAKNIKIIYQEFTCPVYPQLHGEFIPNLSALDLLFNCGPESKSILMAG